MADDLKTRSKGELSMALYSSGQLGSERELIELLQVGAVDMTKVSASPLEGFAKEMGVFSLPYLFEDNDHYWRVLNSDIGRKLLESLRPKRLVGIGYFDAGARSFYSSEGVVETPESLKGKKIRVMNSNVAIATMDALGAAATPISWGEVYTSLQSGVVDAAENNPPSYFSSRHFEVAKFYSLDEHASIPDVILLSAQTYERMTEPQRQWLRESMAAATLYQRRIWKQATDEALQKVEAAGVTIHRPDKTAFRGRVSVMYDKLEGTVIGDLSGQIKAMKGDEK